MYFLANKYVILFNCNFANGNQRKLHVPDLLAKPSSQNRFQICKSNA